MSRKLGTIAAIFILITSLATATANAGGWSIVKLDALPTDVVAGEGFTVAFTVLQHGEQPLADLQPSVTATNAETGERLRFEATPQGEAGHYVARVTLTDEGTWDWSVNAFEGDHWMPPLNVLAAGRTQPDPPPTFAPAATEAVSDSASLTPARLIALGLGAAGMLLLVSAAILAFGLPRAVATVRPLAPVPERFNP